MNPRLLDLPHGYHTVIDEEDWPLVSGLTLYRGTNGYAYYSVWRDGKTHPDTLHSFLIGPHAAVSISFLTDRPVTTTDRFRLLGFAWEPGDAEITYIDEIIEP